MIILKLVMPFVIVYILYRLNKKRLEERLENEVEEKPIPAYVFGALTEDTKKKLERSGLENIEETLTRLQEIVEPVFINVYSVIQDEKIIATIIFSNQSGLWRFRQGRGEEGTLGSYSHIHYLYVVPEHRGEGHFYKLLDMVISDTHRISSGITADVQDELKDLFKKKFEFSDCGTYMILRYDNWS